MVKTISIDSKSSENLLFYSVCVYMFMLKEMFNINVWSHERNLVDKIVNNVAMHEALHTQNRSQHQTKQSMSPINMTNLNMSKIWGTFSPSCEAANLTDS